MKKPDYVYVTYIATTPEKAWQALTDTKQMRRWWVDPVGMAVLATAMVAPVSAAGRTFYVATNGSDTLAVPGGLSTNTSHVAALPLDGADTAKTVASITQAAHPGDASISLTGGTNGSEQFICSLHMGNPAGL